MVFYVKYIEHNDTQKWWHRRLQWRVNVQYWQGVLKVNNLFSWLRINFKHVDGDLIIADKFMGIYRSPIPSPQKTMKIVLPKICYGILALKGILALQPVDFESKPISTYMYSTFTTWHQQQSLNLTVFLQRIR